MPEERAIAALEVEALLDDAGRARRDVRAEVIIGPHAPRAAAAADALVRKEGRKDAAGHDRERDRAGDRGLDDRVRRLVGVHADDRARARLAPLRL